MQRASWLLGSGMLVAGGAAVGFVLGRRDEGEASRVRAPAPLLDAALTMAAPTKADPTWFGVPQTHWVRRHDGFALSYSGRHRCADWVAEYLPRRRPLPAGAAADDAGADRARSEFKEDASIPPHLRARLVDFAHSGYDRGHLAPAADHASSQARMDATFTLSNVVPQSPSLNREYWARLEKFVRDLTKRFGA